MNAPRSVNHPEHHQEHLQTQQKLQETAQRLAHTEQYLHNVITVHHSKGNKGEKDELLVLYTLVHYNQTQEYSKLVEIFGDEAEYGIQVLDPSTGLPTTKINKSRHSNKADTIVIMNKTQNEYRISIKSINCAKPAILNHTPRSANVFKGILKPYLKSLDTVIAEYIYKRTNGTVSEDVLMCELDTLKDPQVASDMFKVLEYFVFDGTGRGASKCPANAILYYGPNTLTFIRACDQIQRNEYVKSIANKYVMSTRKKGMPSSITPECEPWVYRQKGKAKGSLHIRLT